ncbi:hypothetical protein [Actinocrispum wychmicini]|uniref:Uncharacterized protein n=1 Tax=Actinocrispum wychmicini TaxID=1213861 RepID=A0A4R2JIK0_9PSEU|nr:hypothetical protein [Actinocrispum wychmicini]TCO56826.1 hypothetical protein EV192_106301 [Actinocrispum wychmicini]
MPDRPAELLGEKTALRRGYAFPLLVLGLLVLVAPVFYVSAAGDPHMTAYQDIGPFPAFALPWVYRLRYPVMVEWYWVIALLLGFAATAWWYRRQAGSVSDHLAAGGAAVAAFVVGSQIMWKTSHAAGRLYETPGVTLWILAGSVATGAVVVFAGFRWRGLRTASVFVGTLLAMIAFATLGVHMANGLVALVIIAVALLVLALAERSRWLGVVGAVFLIAAVHANLQGLAHFFPFTTPRPDERLTAVANLILPAAVLVVGGVVAFVRARR